MSTILQEVTRSEYIQRSKASDKYVPWNRMLGNNRFERRLHQRVTTSTREFNKVDMNNLFKNGTLDISIIVHGETDDYIVRIVFTNLLVQIRQEISRTNDVTRRTFVRAIVSAFNDGDILTRCNCADYRYRIAYHATKDGAIAGVGEDRPSDITNPNNTKGDSCKHINMVISNNAWITKIASVIYNYINYMKEHYNSLYATIIYPALYDKEYEDEYQADMFDDGNLDDAEDVIDTSNKWAKTKTQFKQGNEYRFKPNTDNPDQTELVFDNEPETQKTFNFDSLMSDS